MARWLIPVIALILPVVATAACWGPTQIIVSVDTDLACATVNAKQFAIVVASSEDLLLTTPSVATSGNCSPGAAAGDQSLGTLTLVPSGERDARVFVKVVIGIDRDTDQCVNGTDTSGCIVARRSTSFVVHDSLNLPMRLDSACLGVDCGSGASCDRGLCVSDDCHLDPAGCSGPGTTDDSGTPPNANATNKCSDVTKGDCDSNIANGCETNLLTSETNCGACGRSCGIGGTCTNGMCEVKLLIGGIDSPDPITTTPTNVFIGLDVDTPAQSSVISCPLDSCSAPVTAVSTGHTHINALSSFGNEIYWGTDDGVWRCTGDGCRTHATLNHMCPDPAGARSVAVTKNNVFYAVSSVSGFQIQECPKSDALSMPSQFTQATTKVEVVLATEKEVFFGVTASADGTLVLPGFGHCTQPCPVGRYGPTLTTPKIPGQSGDGTVVYDNNVLFWSDATNINATPATLTGSVVPLAAAIAPKGIVTDGFLASNGHIYWAETSDTSAGGSIHRMKKDGSEKITLAAGQRHPTQLALATLLGAPYRLYWTNNIKTITDPGGNAIPMGEVRYTAP